MVNKRRMRGDVDDADVDVADIVREPKRQQGSTGDDFVDYVPRQKKRTYPLAKEIAEAVKVAVRANIKKQVEPFPFTHFGTFEDFDRAWTEYCKIHYISTRTRHSLLRDAANDNAREAFKARKQKLEAKKKAVPGKFHAIPASLTYGVRFLWCTHGCIQATRSNGERYHAETRYTGCQARITATAVRDHVSGDWYVRVDKQNVTHNHSVDADLYEAYRTDSSITDAELFKAAIALAECNSPTKLVCDYLSHHLGRTFDAQMWRNFKLFQIGGVQALASLNPFANAS